MLFCRLGILNMEELVHRELSLICNLQSLLEVSLATNVIASKVTVPSESFILKWSRPVLPGESSACAVGLYNICICSSFPKFTVSSLVSLGDFFS